jgi:hypothetical protein
MLGGLNPKRDSRDIQDAWRSDKYAHTIGLNSLLVDITLDLLNTDGKSKYKM